MADNYWPWVACFFFYKLVCSLTVVAGEDMVKVEAIMRPATVAEGPHWDHDKQMLYIVDIFASGVRQYDPSTNKENTVTIDGGQPVTFVIPIKDYHDKFLISVGRQLAVLTWDGKSSVPTSVDPIVIVDDQDGKKENRLNDGKADSTGRLWAGTMGAKLGPGKFVMENGDFFSMSSNKTVSIHLTEISCSNGIAWNQNNQRMYYTDSFTWRVDVMDFDAEKGQVSNRRPFFDYKANAVEGHPDGMTTDTDGLLYLPCFGGGQVLVLDHSGNLVRSITIPALRCTSVAFGGANLDELYVTTATEDATEEELEKYPLSGSTFKVTGLGAKGHPGQPVIIDL